MNNRIWITWETQRRNKELADAFGCDYLCIDMPSNTPRLKRYIKSIFLTYKELKKGYKTIFIQCPSIVLLVFVTLWNILHKKCIVVDAHNAAIESATYSKALDKSQSSYLKVLARKLLKHLILFCMRHSKLVIVSNDALKEKLLKLKIESEPLPDKVPAIAQTHKQTKSQDRLKAILISSFAKDEPIKILIEAFISANLQMDLYITGQKKKAGDLLSFECESIHFTDFLPTHEFDSLIASADLLIDITTRDDCLVCGAYEAMAVGVPTILSDTRANRLTFANTAINTSGFLFAKNTVDDLKQAFFTFASNPNKYRIAIQDFRPVFEGKWAKYFEEIMRKLI